MFSSEWNRFCRETYLANFDCEHDIAGDITEIAAENIREHDVLLAGFPCQRFSIAGVSKKDALGREHRFRCDAQGTLFFDVAGPAFRPPPGGPDRSTRIACLRWKPVTASSSSRIRVFSSQVPTTYRLANALTNSSRAVVVIFLKTNAPKRVLLWGASQMRQRLRPREHFQ